MKNWIKLVLGLLLVGAGLGLVVYLNRRKPAGNTAVALTTAPATTPALAQSAWAVSDALQQTHLNALADQVANAVSRSELASMMDQFKKELATLQPAPGTGTGIDPADDADFVALFNSQLAA
ncbi:hypothetical protein [Spirosoma luteolum]